MTGALTVGTGPILGATDFSDASTHALLWASRQASLERKPLCILHVAHDTPGNPGFYRTGDEDIASPIISVAEDMMEDYIARLRSEHPEMSALAAAQTTLVTGLPPGRIVEVAGNLDASMIVIGNRGRSRLSSILLGSVATRVAQLSPVPVLIVPSPKTDESAEAAPEASE